MDDCLVISQLEKVNETLFCKLNVLHKKISFTKEVSINSQIPFLDIFITKSKERFLTSLYRKPSFISNICISNLFVLKKEK